MPEPLDRDLRDDVFVAGPDSDPEPMLAEHARKLLVRLPRPPPDRNEPPF
jgi:hypothetical protein